MKNERIWILDIMDYVNCDAITNSNYQQETWDYKTVIQHYWKKDWMVDATEEPRVDMELKCKALNVTEMEMNGRD